MKSCDCEAISVFTLHVVSLPICSMTSVFLVIGWWWLKLTHFNFSSYENQYINWDSTDGLLFCSCSVLVNEDPWKTVAQTDILRTVELPSHPWTLCFMLPVWFHRCLSSLSQRCALNLLWGLPLLLISLAGSLANWRALGINQGLSEFKRSDWTAHKFEASFEDRKLSSSFSSLIKISQALTLTGTEDKWVN